MGDFVCDSVIGVNTKQRLSSGKKVNSALDDPINFFSALGHSQRAADLSGRKDHMGEPIQAIRAANRPGIDSIQQLLTSAKSLAQSALNSDDQTARTALAEQYAGMNEVGANMLMLQTRQTLAVTALNLASRAAQSVLRLF